MIGRGRNYLWAMCSWRSVLLTMTIALIPVSKAQQVNFSLLPKGGNMRAPSSLVVPAGTVAPDLLRMPTPWSYERLGVFCKLDVQLERHLRIPVLFRLGDVQRVEAMEGKGPLRDHR